jgi:adenosine deaminase
MSAHPIRKLYDAGVHVTINSDDILVFNQTVSQEYLNLYTAGVMTASELDGIRVNAFRDNN